MHCYCWPPRSRLRRLFQSLCPPRGRMKWDFSNTWEPHDSLRVWDLRPNVLWNDGNATCEGQDVARRAAWLSHQPPFSFWVENQYWCYSAATVTAAAASLQLRSITAPAVCLSVCLCLPVLTGRHVGMMDLALGTNRLNITSHHHDWAPLVPGLQLEAACRKHSAMTFISAYFKSNTIYCINLALYETWTVCKSKAKTVHVLGRQLCSKTVTQWIKCCRAVQCRVLLKQTDKQWYQ